MRTKYEVNKEAWNALERNLIEARGQAHTLPDSPQRRAVIERLDTLREDFEREKANAKLTNEDGSDALAELPVAVRGIERMSVAMGSKYPDLKTLRGGH